MKTRFCGFVLALLVSIAVQAQGIYATHDMPYWPGNDFIETDVTGYPGSNQCSGMDVWNAFNGDYVSGPDNTDLMSGSYGVENTDYSWNYGYTFYFTDPYSGQCTSHTYTASFYIAFGSTTSATLASTFGHADANAWCAQITAGTNNPNPTCTNTAYPRYPIGRPGVKVGYDATAPCAGYYDTLIINISGTIELGPSFDVSGPGYCTPGG